MYLSDAYHDTIVDFKELSRVTDIMANVMNEWLAADNRRERVTHLAATGTSGLSMAYPLSIRCKLPVLAVRRKGETDHGAHSGNLIGQGNLLDYIIVDDFIHTGATIEHIMRSIDQGDDGPVSKGPKCRGIFLYQSSRGWPFMPDLDPELAIGQSEIPVIGNPGR